MHRHEVFMVILMLLMSVDPCHGAVYKWRDKNGRVHYSDSPGPGNNTADQVSANSKRIRPDYEQLKGLWYASDRQHRLMLRVDRYTLVLETSPAYSSPVPGFNANWRSDDGKLNITYNRYDRDPDQIGRDAIIYIHGLENDSLVLQLPGGGKYNFHRALHRRKSRGDPNTKRKLYGKWRSKQNQQFTEFKEGHFNVTAKDQYKSLKQGHWEIQQNMLIMTYYDKDFISGHESVTGRENFRILQISDQELILEKAGDKTRKYYFKSLLE